MSTKKFLEIFFIDHSIFYKKFRQSFAVLSLNGKIWIFSYRTEEKMENTFTPIAIKS